MAIYRSNLKAPDLQPYFEATTICKPRPWSFGHDVMSDKEYDPECCFLSHDEAAILYNVALRVAQSHPDTFVWADIGSRFGWSTAHVHYADSLGNVCAVDPIMQNNRRYFENLERFQLRNTCLCFPWTSAKFFEVHHPLAGASIDGNHDAPEPINDARWSLDNLQGISGEAIVFHDFWGRPIREGVEYLISQGLKCRVYNTPAGMAVCWRGDFSPPDHVADPEINWAEVRKTRAPEFDFGVCV